MPIRIELALFFVIAAMCLPATAADQTFVTQWGPYSVRTGPNTHDPVSDPDRSRMVEIVDHAGHVERRITAAYTTEVKEIAAGRGLPRLLLVSVGDGGNSGLDLIYLYTYNSAGVRNVGALSGVLSDFTLKDLDGDGIRELVVRDVASLNEFDHFSRGGIGEVDRVYRWNGHAYVDATSRFSRMAIDRARSDRSQILKSLRDAERYVRSKWVDGHDDSMASSHENVMSPFIEFWANERVAGRDANARQFFRGHCSPTLYRWLMGRDKLLKDALAPISRSLPVANRAEVGAL
jgi:hypothetical protein